MKNEQNNNQIHFFHYKNGFFHLLLVSLTPIIKSWNHDKNYNIYVTSYALHLFLKNKSRSTYLTVAIVGFWLHGASSGTVTVYVLSTNWG